MYEKKIIIYSDFDGTITTYDAFDKIIEEVYSYATYKKLERLTIENKLSSETYLEMFKGIHYDIVPLANDVDETFKEFYDWVKNKTLNFIL
jgi:2-hydroxy-3-keto-5-methylthiopentenyl-1-phosphate phosphatase